jgi:quinol monooxygenase YgiN
MGQAMRVSARAVQVYLVPLGAKRGCSRWGAIMTESKDVDGLFDKLARILLRCFILGYCLIFLWFVVYIFAGDLGGKLFGLTPHEVDVITYCGIAFAKCVVLLFFLIPYIAIRLVSKRGAWNHERWNGVCFPFFRLCVGEWIMATISKERRLMTLVNVFTVSPEKQNELAEVLVRATEETMRHLPGFISASIHRSIDGTKVVNYAQWRSQEDFTAMKENPKARPHMEAAAKLAKFDPIVCEVVESTTTD